MTTLAGVLHPLARIVRGPAAVHRGSSGAHTAIRMAPFNMAGVAGLLATCAAVAASAAHLLPLLLLLICPRGTQAEQGKRSLARSSIRSRSFAVRPLLSILFFITFFCLSYVGLIKPR